MFWVRIMGIAGVVVWLILKLFERADLNRREARAKVLHLLENIEGEMYGLEMVRCSGGVLKRDTVPVILNEMEKEGLIESHFDDKPTPPGVPRRRLYRLRKSA